MYRRDSWVCRPLAIVYADRRDWTTALWRGGFRIFVHDNRWDSHRRGAAATFWSTISRLVWRSPPRVKAYNGAARIVANGRRSWQSVASVLESHAGRLADVVAANLNALYPVLFLGGRGPGGDSRVCHVQRVARARRRISASISPREGSWLRRAEMHPVKGILALRFEHGRRVLLRYPLRSRSGLWLFPYLIYGEGFPDFTADVALAALRRALTGPVGDRGPPSADATE